MRVLSGAKNFVPYQCPSPKMAQKSAGAFIDNFLPRLSGLYNRWCRAGAEVRGVPQHVYCALQEQNIIPWGGGPGQQQLPPNTGGGQDLEWPGGQHQEHQVHQLSRSEKVVKQMIMITSINLHDLHHRNGFLPISSEVAGSELGVVRVAVVGLGQGRNINNLDNWYSQPDEGNKVMWAYCT